MSSCRYRCPKSTAQDFYWRVHGGLCDMPSASCPQYKQSVSGDRAGTYVCSVSTMELFLVRYREVQGSSVCRRAWLCKLEDQHLMSRRLHTHTHTHQDKQMLAEAWRDKSRAFVPCFLCSKELFRILAAAPHRQPYDNTCVKYSKINLL
jgi:hypothetical protein